MEPIRPDQAVGGADPTSSTSTSPADALRRGDGDRLDPHGLKAFVLSHGWAFLIALLAVEVIGLTIHFDSANIQAGLESFSELAQATFQVLAVASGVWLVFRGGEERGSPQAVKSGCRIRWHLIPAHLATLFGFVGLTAILFERGSPFPAPAFWAAAWVVMGLATLGTWLAIGAPPAQWIPWTKRRRGPLLGCLAIGLAAWALARFAEQLWKPLAWGTLRLVHRLLQLVSPEVIFDPVSYRVGTPAFQVEIAPPCSGYEGMGMILALLGVYLWVDRRSLRFPHALILLPLGMSIIWLVNAARIAALVWLATQGYREVALGGFHSQAGWLAFLAVGLGMIALARLWPFVSTDRGDEFVAGDRWPSAPYLLPLLVGIAALMLTRAVSDDPDRLYPLRVVAVGGSLWAFQAIYARWRWNPSWQAVAIGTVAFIAWVGLTAFSPSIGSGTVHSRIGLATSSRVWLIVWISFRIVGAVITAPLAEELAFRAYLTRRLIKSDYSSLAVGTFSWPSFLVSSALFGLLHGSWLAGTVAGMLYALALYRRGQVADAVLAHATTNACLTAYVLITGNWWLWN